MTQQILNDEEIVTELDISHLTIEDDTPVDNFQSAKQQRLLVEPLYASWSPGVPFVADSNIGLFYALKQDPLVPDAFLSLNLQMPTDWSQKQNRSYFVWEFGKVPEVCIEIVSNRKGNELDSKKDDYAQIGVAYYVVFDPLQQLQREGELNGNLLKIWVLTAGQYVEMSEPFWLQTVKLGLTLWNGEFEGQESTWLRWCDDREGRVIPTGAERADEAELKAQRLAERLRAMGVDPNEI
ncbi:MAG: Uma2 family endonuclease [Candidatus Parcubacteria bacterium]|uniref:Uma2 family endonuclease n=1 Tax=Phormidesmis priestleyi TaxID=268141 RepID=UPI00083B7466|nr:Uma2 family endonuclease [Phormidesmis priestleyi]MBC7824604.1 Uma2 family endonuclease [Leptolyngbyaceae cyanobacterium LF-bin-113]